MQMDAITHTPNDIWATLSMSPQVGWEKKIDLSKFKAFADNRIKVTQKFKCVLYRVEKN